MSPNPLPIDVSAIWSAWGTPDFERILTAQLHAHWRQIPLEKVCENGGLPDNPHFHNFRSAEPRPGTLEITFDASFRETVVPGCGGIPAEQIRFAEFMLEVTPGQCFVEYRERRREPEF